MNGRRDPRDRTAGDGTSGSGARVPGRERAVRGCRATSRRIDARGCREPARGADGAHVGRHRAMVATESAAPGGRGRPPLSGESCGSQRPISPDVERLIRPDARTLPGATVAARRSTISHRSRIVRPMSATAIASPPALARAPAASRARPDPRAATTGTSIPVGARRHRAQPRATAPSRATRFFGGDASPAKALASSMGRPRRRSRGRDVGPAPCRALASPNELGDVAGTLGLSLSGFEQVMGKASFGALLGASGVYCYKVSVVVRRRVETRITARENGAPDARTQPRAPHAPKCPNPYPRSSLAESNRSNRRERDPRPRRLTLD